MVVTDSNKVLSTTDYKVVGTRPFRHDGTDKVTGRAQYGADIRMPLVFSGKILRSPHAHARIKSIDTSRALALPGVKAVVTAEDLPRVSGVHADSVEAAENVGFISYNCLARDKVLYKGHAVAAVAATGPHIAEEALSLIDVDYEVLPAVFNALDAMKDDAPILHERLYSFSDASVRSGGLRPDGEDGKGTNIANHFVFKLGDIEKGFKEADLVVEREYSTVRVHQGYIEPHTCTVLWNSDDTVTVWCSTQGHFNVREQTAKVLDIPISKVKVVPMEIGGGFGAKITIYLEPVAAVLSRKTGHPVNLTMSRTEELEATGPTSGSYVKVKMGVTKQGRITAAEAYLAFDAGAFPGSPVNSAAQCAFGPYNISHARAEGFDVVTNRPKAAAYRAPGAPIGAFATETVIDEICEKLGMDPIEFRILNAASEGTRRVSGVAFRRIGYFETLQAAKEHEHYKAPLGGPNRGRGIASGFWRNNAGPSSAVASVNPDGTVSLVEGSPDIGGSRAALSMHLAEVLGIPAEDVRPVVADTDSVGFTSLTGGSAVVFKTGWACYEAAQDVKRQMCQRAALLWDVPAEDVDLVDGVFAHKSDPELRISFKELADRLNDTGGPVVGRATVDPKGVGVTFATHMADVEVDPETGKVQVLRYTAIQDAGKAIHPSYVESQMQGGVAQGIGWALNEEYVLNEKGEMINPTLLDYRMPTSLDLPMIDTVIVEVPNEGHPYGARGVGEIPIVPPLATLANAIYHAVEVRMRELPMSPGNILEALWEKDGKE